MIHLVKLLNVCLSMNIAQSIQKLHRNKNVTPYRFLLLSHSLSTLKPKRSTKKTNFFESTPLLGLIKSLSHQFTFTGARSISYLYKIVIKLLIV